MPRRKSIPSPEPTYEVELIRKARVSENKSWEYYIKWGGYPEDENTWEPDANLTGCRRMFKGFWEDVGAMLKATVRSLSVGHEVEPSRVWIERERKSYRKTSEKKKKARQSKVDEMEEEDEDEEDEGKAGKGAGMIDKTSLPPEETYSDPDDIPLSMKVGRQTEHQTIIVPEGVIDTSKRKRNDEHGETDRPPSSEPPTKRLKNQAEVTSAISAPEIPPKVVPKSKDKKKKAENSSSPAGSLFGDSDSDTPLASKSSTPAVSSKPQQNQSTSDKPIARPSLSVNTSATGAKPLPAHLQRKLNPRVKPMVLPATLSNGPQGISTKARIFAQGATTQAGPTSADTVTPNTPHSSAPTAFDANKWLEENIVAPDQISVLPSTSNTQQNLHFNKRWRWTGQLAVGDNESEDAFADPVGSILVSDDTLLDQTASGIELRQLLSADVDSLCLRHLYSLAALPTALNDFKISQFARMTMDPASEDNSFSDVVAYMTKYGLYSQAPLSISNHHAATMFVFPASLEYLWERLGIPPKIRQDQGLLVAIGFQIYVPPKGELGGFTEPYRSDWKARVKADAVSETSARSYHCGRALLALAFPDNLFRRLAQKECAIFTTPADNELPGPDTLALKTVLNNAPACKLASLFTGTVRFIFIHVGAWNTLHKLVGLVDRRIRRQDVQFYTYGSDPTVDRKHWGIHEVFPIGGIVTFTPRAIAEDPEGVQSLINRLHEHPLWACYVLPSVVAKIIDVANSDSGPDSKLKGAIEALCSILIPIEKGQIALTWQPPSYRSWYPNGPNEELQPKTIDWVIDQAHLSDLQGHELVQECQTRLKRSQDLSEKDVESSIVKDMLVMQSVLREEYRRFVIITDSTGFCNDSREAAANTSASKLDIKDGFEFTHVKDFKFGDDYPFADN